MTVPVGKRGENTLEVWLKAVELAKYTMEITANTKSFPGRYRPMTDRINAAAIEAAGDLWKANKVFVGQGCDPRAREDRRFLQNRAINHLDDLLFLIDLSGKLLHRDGKKSANCACQAGKGTDYARARLVKMLKRHWHHHGTAGYVLQMDVAGYYPNMRHDRVLELFARRLDPDSYGHVEAILSRQYAGDVGFEPGSQLVQIAGIAALDGLDHVVKERLGVKAYIRYMDDMLCLGETREGLERVRDEVSAWLEPMGLWLHPSKTRVQRIDRRIPWLGFTFELKPSGFVCVRAKPAKMRDARRRLKRVADAVSRGSMTPEKADEIAGTMTRYLRRNCSGRGQPAKMEEYWKTLRKGGAWNTGARPISA